MLTCIAGITEQVAAGIVAQYPTNGALMNKYRSLPTTKACQLLLKDVTIQRNQGKTSRVGPAISCKVYHNFYGNMDGSKIMNV